MQDRWQRHGRDSHGECESPVKRHDTHRPAHQELAWLTVAARHHHDEAADDKENVDTGAHPVEVDQGRGDQECCIGWYLVNEVEIDHHQGGDRSKVLHPVEADVLCRVGHESSLPVLILIVILSYLLARRHPQRDEIYLSVSFFSDS